MRPATLLLTLSLVFSFSVSSSETDTTRRSQSEAAFPSSLRGRSSSYPPEAVNGGPMSSHSSSNARAKRNIPQNQRRRSYVPSQSTSRPFALYQSFGTPRPEEEEEEVQDDERRRRLLIQQLLRPRTTSTVSTTTTTSTTSSTTSTVVVTTSVASEASNANELVKEILEDTPVHDEASNTLKEGDIRLVNGRSDREGNVEIFHMGTWGSICDDEWDTYDANVVCKQLGFPGAERHTHSSQFGYSLSWIWMDNVYCVGTEEAVSDCRFDGWGIHDCERTEAAGVQCKPKPPPTTTPAPTTTPRPKIEIHKTHGHALKIRISGGRHPLEGRVEVQLDEGGPWGTICGDGWGVREAMVVCKELGLGFAQSGTQTHVFNGNSSGSSSSIETLSGVACKGTEDFLSECHHDATNFCPGTGINEVAAVICVQKQADLALDLYALMSSVYLEDKHLFFLQCAMEENCLAEEAYRLRRDNPNFSLESRRLLRFTTSIENVGDTDFRPFIPKAAWQWHACHMHYHSMEVFAHFDILDFHGNRLLEGHKASFCLEDNECSGPYEAHYDCENYGDQGITPGCKDIYYANIDCQWLDVTELELGTYVFRMAINPEYKVAERTFENNAALCTLVYTQQYASIFNCSYAMP